MKSCDSSSSSPEPRQERNAVSGTGNNTENSTSRDETLKSLIARIELLEKAVVRHGDQAEINEGVVADSPAELPLTIHDARSGSGLYDIFELPESTFTFLITHKFLSIPFFTGLIAYALALFCLILVLIDEEDKGTQDNP